MAGSNSCVDLEQLVLKLHGIGAIKFGVKLKTGEESPVYFDLRVMISHPVIMGEVADIMWEYIQKSNCEFDSICGAPYAAIPIATRSVTSYGSDDISGYSSWKIYDVPLDSETGQQQSPMCIAVKYKVPMLLCRKEAKSYGTRKLIEGQYKAGERCLVVEDVVTYGHSILETAQTLSEEGIVVKEAITMVDRGQGGKIGLRKQDIKLHCVVTLTEVMTILQKHNKLDEETINKMTKFQEENCIQE